MLEEIDSYREMIIYAVGPNFISYEETNHEEPLNPVAKMFFDMRKVVETLLVEVDDRHSMFSACEELLYIRSENQWTQKSYDDEELDIAIETYFEKVQNDETEIEWDSNEEIHEDSDAESDNDMDEDSYT
ncbi:hypothetical protein M9H77_34036 [Catharanthus roseus]|uniref:Uncharacterized protein n=1 Tax=Catharanthus roseus TaxID=4058 RepID=A0ACB9ZL81_CATRO|nr:hypothetical protein M9H77_34036 [Catharanthus roseus]